MAFSDGGNERPVIGATPISDKVTTRKEIRNAYAHTFGTPHLGMTVTEMRRKLEEVVGIE